MQTFLDLFSLHENFMKTGDFETASMYRKRIFIKKIPVKLYETIPILHSVTDSQNIKCFYKAACLYELLFVVVHVYYVNHNLTQAKSIKQSAGKTRCSDSAQQLLPLQHNSFRKRVHVLKS